MELLKSKKFKLPTLYFISDREEIKELPIGIPFIYGEEDDKSYIIRLLEYEVLYEKAKSTGLPFNFKQILRDNGFDDIEEFWYHHTAYMEYTTSSGDYDIDDFDLGVPISEDETLFKQFVRDSTAYVDTNKLKELNVFPIWLDNIEKAIETNIQNFAIFNPNMYNKKLDGMYGGVEFVSPNRNLIVIDISGSIPKAVSSTILALCKQLAETFYADILITGTISTLYTYENIHELNIKTIYDTNGMDNDSKYFRKIVSSEEKHYKTAIVFGDNHSPLDYWNSGNSISREVGKEMCKWKIDKLISFHTTSTIATAGYADMFSPDTIEKVSDWVKYLN